MIRILGAAVCAFLLFSGFALAQSADDIAALKARQLYKSGDYAAALALVQPLAEKGHPRAQTLLGVMAELGLGLSADPARGVELYLAAAEQGFAPAMHNLGFSYETGLGGLVQDEAIAREWYWKAAAQDYGPSLSNLALFMLDGRGGPKDPETALALFERASLLGDPNGTAWLAYLLATGDDGAEIDLPRARQLYEVAAAHGIDWAERDYGEMLELAEGGPADLVRAKEFYQRAVAQGNPMAGYDIAEMAWANREVFPDKVEALAYCLWAEAMPPMWDGSDYDGKCDQAAAALGAEDVAKAKTMADSF